MGGGRIGSRWHGGGWLGEGAVVVNYILGFNCCRYSPGKCHILCVVAAVPVAWVMVAPPAEISSNIFRRTDQL